MRRFFLRSFGTTKSRTKGKSSCTNPLCGDAFICENLREIKYKNQWESNQDQSRSYRSPSLWIIYDFQF